MLPSAPSTLAGRFVLAKDGGVRRPGLLAEGEASMGLQESKEEAESKVPSTRARVTTSAHTYNSEHGEVQQRHGFAVARALGWTGVGIGVLGLAAPGPFTGLLKGKPSRKALRRSRALGAAAAAAGLTTLAIESRLRSGPSTKRAFDVGKTATIRKDAGELFRCLQSPDSFKVMMAPVAEVRALGDSSMRWTLPRGVEFDMRVVERRDPEFVHWQSSPGAPIRGDVVATLHPAPHDQGTEVTLRLRFDAAKPVLRAFSSVVREMKMLPNLVGLVASRALHRLKSLVETGEVPTVHGQPAARNGGRDN
ncbi:MAG TPA: SRPBCC family protein [Labilithrix sp.]|nr:SRPBCC family protein [Labilithrix sp.]